MSEDKQDFVSGTLHEVTPRGGTSGAIYRDIMSYQQGTLRLRATNGGPDVIIPDTYFCDAKRNKGGCIGRNIINPTEAGLHAADTNLNIRYDGDLAFLATNNLKNHPAIFEKVNDDQAKDMFRYLPPGTKPWGREKWEKENPNKPACNRGKNWFGIGDKICDTYEKWRKEHPEGLKGSFGFGA